MSKFKNVAISLPSNTYAGESYAEYMTPALLKPKGIVDRGLVTPIQGFKDKIALLGADAALELKNPSAVFSSQSSGLVRNEKSLQLVKYELQLQTDYDALRTTWEATELGAGSFADYLGTPRLSNFYLNNIIAPKLGGVNEQLYLLGKAGVNYGGSTATGISADYAGILGQLEAGSDVNKYKLSAVASATQALTAIATGTVGTATITVTDGTKIQVGNQLTITAANQAQQIGGTTIVGQTVTVAAVSGETVTVNEAITGATDSTAGVIQFVNKFNVIDVLNFIYNTIPQVVKDMDNTRILVSAQIADAYRVVNGEAGTGAGGYFREDYFQSSGIPFLGLVIEKMPLWLPNTVAVWNPSNVFVGFDLMSDDVNVEVLYLGQTTGDRVFRAINSMKSGTQYKYGAEILYIRPKA